jgi:hypothetical protein
MKTLTDIFTCLLLCGLALLGALFLLGLGLGVVGLAVKALWIILYPLYFVTLKPFVWFAVKAFQSRCPKCKVFWKKRFVKSEVVEQKESLETVERIDEGTIYSNSVFDVNHAYEVKRLEQVRMVQETTRHFWECKDPICDHKWTTEEYSEYEGSLDEQD